LSNSRRRYAFDFLKLPATDNCDIIKLIGTHSRLALETHNRVQPFKIKGSKLSCGREDSHPKKIAFGVTMEKEEKKEFTSDVSQGIKAAMSDPRYWERRRSKWDEWSSPIGLGLAWTLFVVPLGLFLVLLHMAGLLR